MGSIRWTASGAARRWLLALGLVAATAAAGCGGNSSSSSNAKESINKASGTKSAQAAMADAGTAAATKAGTAMQLKPQIVGMVEILHAAEVQRRITQALKDAAAKVGWKVITCDTAGDPAKASSCAQNLITQGATAMTSMGVDPSTMGAQMKQAKAKGIPWLGLVGTERESPLFTAQINQPDQQAISDVMSKYILGRLETADASARKGGGFAYSTFPAIYGIGLRDTKTAAALRTAGLKQVSRHVTDLANNAADARQWARSVLTRTPDVGAFFTTLDIDQGEIANAVAAKFPGKAFPERPLVVGLAAGLGTLDKIRKGLIDADVEVAVEAASWMGVDQLAEYFARKTSLATDLWAGDKTDAYPEWFLKPYTVTKENAPKQSGVYHDPPYDFVTYFTSKWGKEFGAT
jgi:ABC-type sugar transport system substrate-binding protein